MSDFRVPRIMGIINCTPDSFFAGSRVDGIRASRDLAVKMIREGAEILDIGGESTRPGSAGVNDDEQLTRVVPVIKDIRQFSDITISIDTRSARVAEAALNAGADIINDISALKGDPSMAALAAERAVPVILMHMKGTPADMQDNPYYADPVEEIREELQKAAGRGVDAGIKPENIILDPGIGFGKRLEDNTSLLAHIDRWRPGDFMILIGLSRKSFLGRIIDEENKRSSERARQRIDQEFAEKSFPVKEPVSTDTADDRLVSTVAAHAWCLTKGVDILRVHDVKETRQLLAVWEALTWAS
jgi:dihydropteroate synthase